MDRGSAIHKEAELWLTGPKKVELPETLSLLEKEFYDLHAMKPQCEKAWAFTAAWTPTEWMAPDCWVRIKTDAYVPTKKIDLVIDFKTGKVRDEHIQQLSLYAIGAMVLNTKSKEVDSWLWYLDQGTTVMHSFTRKNLEMLQAEWESKTKAMLADRIFTPRPSPYCAWCSFSKRKGGPCAF